MGSDTLFHLAEFNVARAAAPIDSPALANFVAQIAELNALAEASSGFVWRLKADAGVVFPASLDDPSLLVNMSVWESVEALREYSYSGRHLELFRDRRKWFEPHEGYGLVAWWVPAGHIPSLEEAEARLEHLRQHGDTATAFSLKNAFPPPQISVVEGAPLLYDRRWFVLRFNTSNGESNSSTVFHYRQTGPLVWATYSGGAIRTGTLIANIGRNGSLDAIYHHVNTAGQFRSGVCRTTPEVMADGRLRLLEKWRWAGDETEGRSVLEEIAPISQTSGHASS